MIIFPRVSRVTRVRNEGGKSRVGREIKGEEGRSLPSGDRSGLEKMIIDADSCVWNNV